MSEVSRLLAWGIDLPEYKGKVYRLGEPTQGVKAEYEQWLKQTAMKECIDASRGLPDADVAYNRRLLLEDIRLGKFKWHGEKWVASSGTEEGVVQMVYLLLQEGERTKQRGKNPVSLELAKELYQDRELGPWVMGTIYMESGIDPTMALAMGEMTIAGAEKSKEEIKNNLTSIMENLLGK